MSTLATPPAGNGIDDARRGGCDPVPEQGSGSGSGTGGGPAGRSAWATVLWPLALLGHLAANPGHLLVGDGVGWLQFALIVAAGWLIVRPGAIGAGTLAGLYLLVFWLKLPVVGNHEVILALVAVAMLWGVLGRRPDWPARAASVCRVALIVSYGFIALSKFNQGFFDPVSTCALLFADEVGDLVGLRPSGHRGLVLVAIWATALIEAVIPIALVIRRLRPAGVVLALTFHFFLAIDPSSHVWDFSSTLLPLFVLFLPIAFHRRADAVVARWRARPMVERLASVGLVVAVQALALAGPLPDWFPAYPLWLIVGGGVAVSAARFVAALGPPELDPVRGDSGPLIGGAGPSRSRRWTVGAALVLALGVANGLAPYAELRTAAAFNMYSNLRIVDGDSNHFLVPALPLGFERPYAAVEDPPPGSELAYYRDAGMVVPLESLARFAADHPGEAVVARIGAGRPQGVEAAGRGRLGWLVDALEHKLGFRRAIDGSEPARCLRSWGPIG